MISGNQEKFQKQTDIEFVSRFTALVKSQSLITLWQKGGAKFHIRAEEYLKKSCELHLLIDLEGKEPPVSGDYMIHFVLRNVAFFAKGKLKTAETFVFKVTELFKHEKRRDERLLTYPHRKCFILIPVKDKAESEDTNLIFFNKSQGVKESAPLKYGQYIEQQEERVVGDKHYRPFRVLDLSKGGLSFYANNNEKSFLQSVKSFSKVLVELDGERYLIAKAETLYGIDYLDPRANHVPMYKMGFHFTEENEILTKVIAKELGEAERSDDLASIFEDNF